MASLRQRVEVALRRLAVMPGSDDIFAVQRVQTAGQPIHWEERVSFERGRQQSYTRIRSNADEGQAPIGTWVTAADEWRVKALAQALCNVAIWTRSSDEELLPGMEMVSWTCVTSGSVFDISMATSSPSLMDFVALDSEIQRLANEVESSLQGAFLCCMLEIIPSGINRYEANVSYVNDGNHACLMVNPLVAEPSDENFFRIETAQLPEEELGITDYGAEFKDVPFEPILQKLDEHWDDEYIVLMPGQSLVLPIRFDLDLPGQGDSLIRAVYSNYGNVDDMASMPVIHGRAFSNELQLKL